MIFPLLMPARLASIRPPFERLLVSLAFLAALAACQAEAPAPAVSVATCKAEHGEFAQGVAPAGLPTDPPGGGNAYYQALHRAAPDNLDAARSLAADVTRAADAVDRVSTSFVNLRLCRVDDAEGVRNGGLAPAEMVASLAMERASLEGEIAMARAAAAVLAAHGATLREAADRLAASVPGTEVKVARAVAAPPVPAVYFVVTAAAPIYAKPTNAGPRIAGLRRGQRVQGPTGDNAGGWVQLTLNDGSSGYVEAAVLRPARTNASTLKASAQSASASTADGDPIAQAVFAARVELTDHLQALDAAIETAAAASALAFNPPADPPSAMTAQSAGPPADPLP